MTESPGIVLPRSISAQFSSFASAPLSLGSTFNEILNFVAGTYSAGGFSVALSSLMTTTRASPGTAKNSSGAVVNFTSGQPRITDLGLLVEQASANLLTHSQALSAGDWSPTNLTTTDNQVIAPDGTLTGAKAVPTTTNAQHYQLQGYTPLSAGQTFTLSVFAKPAGYNYFRVAIYDPVANTISDAYFNISTGTIATSDGAAFDLYIEPYAGGWYRCSISYVAATTNLIYPILAVHSASGQINWAGDGTSGVNLWGAQLEIGPLTSYIPTVATTVARAADQNAPTGALATDLSAPQGVAVATIGTISNPTISNFCVLSRSGSVDEFMTVQSASTGYVRVTGSNTQFAVGSRPIFNTGPCNLGTGWSNSGVSAAANGGTVATAPAFAGAFNSFIGSSDGATNFLNNYIQILKVGSTKPANATLRTFTGTAGAVIGAYYVSAAGNDANDGRTIGSPWQTITKVNAATFVPGDSVLFRGGDSISGTLTIGPANVPSLGDKLNPITIDNYGVGQTTIVGNNPGPGGGSLGPKSFVVHLNAVSGVALQNLILSGADNGTQFGVLIENGVNGNVADTVTVKGCDISGFTCTATSDSSTGIFVSGYANAGNCGVLNNISLLNNSIHGSSATGPEGTGVTGYGCGQNIFNILYQGNLIYNLGGRAAFPDISNAALTNGVNTGTIQFNLGHDIGGNSQSCGGPAGFWAYSSSFITVQFNEVYHLRPTGGNTGGNGCDWAAYDMDGGVSNSLVQYNYSHDNAGPALLAFGGSGWGPNTLRYNISENDQTKVNDGGGVIACFFSDHPAYIYNNTIYQSVNTTGTAPPVGVSFGFTGTYPGGYLVANNIFYMLGVDQFGRTRFVDADNGPDITNVTLDYNLYFNNGATPHFNWQSHGGDSTSLAAWRTNSGKDAHSVIANPLLAGAGSGGNVMPNASGSTTGPNPTGPNSYKLTTGSPAIGTGVDLTQAPYNLNVGTRDYFGNTIPHLVGTGYNIGADGGTH